MEKITIDGNTAAARVAYAFSEVAAIYPITPSSTMAELADKMSGEGVKNIFGNTLRVVELQSEGGASGTLHGSLSAGALSTTFTASQGLLLMIPNMYKIAGELLPCVIHVSARSLATHALSIFGDHSDVMATRGTGFAQLCSSSVQEAQDLALVAHLATLHASVPFLHFFDGFRTSHEINTIEDLDMELVKKYIPTNKINEFKARALSSAHPHQQGTAQNPDIFFQNKEAANVFYNKTPEIVKSVMKQIYEITGRKYGLFDYVGSPTAKYVIVMMGSGSTTAETTVKYLNKTKGNDYGLLKVRLYRPFSIKDFVHALPKTTQKIAVLDRTKEPGAEGEPLYKDVMCGLHEYGLDNIMVVGGRYGLGSKEFTPSMVAAIFNNLTCKKSKNHFTVGIEDDITNTSLKIKEFIHPTAGSVTGCKFYGYGGDGTVSANKSSIKIIGNNTKLFGQAYFEYDSKKSGNATITHLRFGKNKIDESYLLDHIDFVAVHNQTYITKYNVLKGLKPNGTLLLNTEYDLQTLETMMPASMKQDLYKNKIKFYTIDAYSIANELGLKNKINLIMQSAFFKLINIIPFSKAKTEMKEMAQKSYGSKGQAVLEANYKAIDSAENKIKQINIPNSWATAENEVYKPNNGKTTKYYDEFISPIEKLNGDSLPVSAFNPRGFVPVGTTAFEKRGIATSLPCWKSENCIQCNMCAFVCPHASIRPYLAEDSSLNNKPNTLTTLPAMAEQGKQFAIQVSPLDCTGCGVCASVCPSKQKALVMEHANSLLSKETKNYNYLESIQTTKSNLFKENSVKGSQFNKPYFEFSGACAGCGETPYIKVISQLFGDRMIIANATGCSSIYGGSAPTCPYSMDEKGYGVAWANSLFEDNAEFGYGIKLGNSVKHDELIKSLKELKNSKTSKKINELVNSYFEKTTANEQREIGKELVCELSKTSQNPLYSKIIQLQDCFAKDSIWIIGGDGWAYDIGFGGLDHILASGENINILVLDTEVYSNTGGQSSKATPTGAVAKFASLGKRNRKKDLALMATTYKDVYVAKVSMGANMNQFLQSVREAESYNGVSLIIAYAPCINHGINMSNSQLEMKKAVECGYWNLWRFNPMLAKENKNPFILDSGNPTKPYEEFLNGETRYTSLKQAHPDLAKQLFEEASKQARESFEDYKKLAETLEKN